MNKENGTFIDVNFIQQFFMNIIVRDDRCWHNTLKHLHHISIHDEKQDNNQ